MLAEWEQRYIQTSSPSSTASLSPPQPPPSPSATSWVPSVVWSFLKHFHEVLGIERGGGQKHSWAARSSSFSCGKGQRQRRGPHSRHAIRLGEEMSKSVGEYMLLELQHTLTKRPHPIPTAIWSRRVRR